MNGGNAYDFVDRIYTCQDTVFIYQGIKYWFQGYTKDASTVHMEVIQYESPKEDYLWEYDGGTIEECQKAFLSAPLFDSKTFWEVEQMITWVDD